MMRFHFVVHSHFIILITLILQSPLRAQGFEPVPAFPHLTFLKPVDLQNAGDGSNRLFVVEQEGTIRVFQNNADATTTRLFLDITDSVHYVNNSELGLLGLAFHPAYESNGVFFVQYTAANPLRSVISRFTVSSDPDSADRASEEVLLEVAQPYTNHNGGQIAFGPDGHLYIGLGDGGSGGDPHNNGQNLATLLGKILRINIDQVDPGLSYGIPPDNPYFGNSDGYREEIYAHGFRNPWRFSFDPPTGRLWCGDVGQNSREEINLVESARNYGWKIMEGTQCYSPSSGCLTAGLELPVWDYPRTIGGSITGGYVYRGPTALSLTGRYVFGDFVSGMLGALTYDGVNPPIVSVLDTLPPYSLTSFGIAEDGELFLCLHSGSILRLSGSAPTRVTDGPSPLSFVLDGNYPNPFNGSTRFRLQVAEPGTVTMRVFDALGREVERRAFPNLVPGVHWIEWHSGTLPTGPYYYELQSGGVRNERKTGRMLLLR